MTYRYALLIAAVSLLIPAAAPRAQDLMPAVDIPEADINAATHPMIRLSPDKSELVKLDRDAVSVVVGNPTHLSVLLDTPRLLVLVPRVPGATSFTVLDDKGGVIMQRHAIVAAPKDKYVRVRRSCAGVPAGTTCHATSVYFCPDICHEVGVTSAEEASGEPDATVEETTTSTSVAAEEPAQ